ncbi:hypothetical protein CO674_33050 [Rhizobium hidalgonense]|uniref:AAA+ ATPase domain-containing protein n=2 Tax=Rhizobium hidalgonense TaxID=1538159 RepID=A0ABX4JHA5_9HYPH|nr:hypothetical protein CO674_33050 [Rhizobium hidalgonense]
MIRLGSYIGPDLSLDPNMGDAKRALWEYLRRSPEERAQRRVPMDETFYLSEPVVEAVRRRCLEKCVFCERDGSFIQLRVETFRPPRDAAGGFAEVHSDWYAWLAYESENLILECVECSSRRRTEFPVQGERAPYLAAMEEVRRRERPLIVDPYRGRVETHFSFLADGRIEGTSAEGRTTVALLRLDHEYLCKQRGDDIGKFLADLRIHVSERPRHGEQVDSMLHRWRPFAGARRGVARRLFEGMEIAGAIIKGSISAFPVILSKAMDAAETPDRDRILQRISSMVAEDTTRQVDRLVYPLEDFRPARDTERQSSRPPAAWIERVHFESFKGLNDITLKSIPARSDAKGVPCLMLLGENAVGKSSILQGIALALIGPSEAKRLKVEPADLLRADSGPRFDQLSPEDAVVRIDFRLFGRTTIFTLDAARRKIRGASGPAGLVLGYGPHRYFDPRRSERPNTAHARVRSLFNPTAALPFPTTWLNSLDPGSFNEVAKLLRVVLALSDNDEVVPDVDGRICVAMGGVPVPLERLSEGYRSILAMIVDIGRELLRYFDNLEDAEAVVLIDEIDTHLHPRWKMRVMGALRRALPRVQFVVTTHDPLCLRGMEDGEVIVLQRDETGAISIVPDLPSIKGMRADQLLTSDFFGLSSTIDPETELGVARFVKAVTDLPDAQVDEANRMVRQLVLGDTALEQVVQEALSRFLSERERPKGTLRTEARAEAVQVILDALRREGRAGPGSEPHSA